MMAHMPDRRATWTMALPTAALVVAVVIGSQMLATAGPPSPTLPPPPAAATTTASPDDDCEESTAPDGCGNEHSIAVRAWVACKAAEDKAAEDKAPEDKDACVKPTPPGRALGHAKHLGAAPGPASTDGGGHGWGRAHAPGQLKPKDKPSSGSGEDE
jgi:hypothetical protein